MSKKRKNIEKNFSLENVIPSKDIGLESSLSQFVEIPYPTVRINATLTPHPTKPLLYLFGGEYDNGKEVCFYDQMFQYIPATNSWFEIRTKIRPPARSAHQIAVSNLAGNNGQLWLFGGETCNPSQTEIHHYNDLWCFHLASNRWEKVEAPNPPPPRSGHRMVTYNNNLLVLFGGFFNNYETCQYYNDLYVFHIENRIWCRIEPKNQKGLIPINSGPQARSAFHFVPYQIKRDVQENGDKARVRPDDNGILLFWGYTIESTAQKMADSSNKNSKKISKSQKKSANGKSKNSEKSNCFAIETNLGTYLTDMYKLFPDPDQTLPANQIPQIWRWSKLKQKFGLGADPNLPSRCGSIALGYQNERILLFGGVFDRKQTEEVICESVFYNDTYQFDIPSATWVPFPILKRHLNDTALENQNIFNEQDEEISQTLSTNIKKVKLKNQEGSEKLPGENAYINQKNPQSIKENRGLKISPGEANVQLAASFIRPSPRMKSTAALLNLASNNNKNNIKNSDINNTSHFALFLYGGMIEHSSTELFDPPGLNNNTTATLKERIDEKEYSNIKGKSKKYKKHKEDATIILDDFYRLDLDPDKRVERSWTQINPGTLDKRITELKHQFDDNKEDSNNEDDSSEDSNEETTTSDSSTENE